MFAEAREAAEGPNGLAQLGHEWLGDPVIETVHLINEGQLDCPEGQSMSAPVQLDALVF